MLFSERTDLLASLHELPDPGVVVVAGATDRDPPGRVTPPDLPVRVFGVPGFRDRAERDRALADWFVSQQVGLVVAGGWLWLLTPEFLARFPHRVVNVHPTLLPAFPGRHSVEAAVDYGVRVHGVTVHLVDDGVDTGPILAQEAMRFPEPVAASKVRAALAPIERRLLGEVVRAFADGRGDLRS